jgi:Beta-lactamase enzyme family
MPNRRYRAVAGPAVLVLAAALLAGCGSSGHASAGRTPSSASAPATPAAVTPTPTVTRTTAPPKPTRAQLKAAATAAVAKLVKHEPGNAVSIAALNTATGASFTYGKQSDHWTASVYKLFVLETLLAQQHAPLTGNQASLATTMIENSNNVAAYSLFLQLGGRSGLIAGARTLGLKHTVPGLTDPTYTTTGGTDQITLLKNLVDSKSPLTKASRAYALGLMRNVEADQRWGVGVIADKGTDFANKNGWLSLTNGNAPGENDNGLWAVNSDGVLTVDHQQVLVSIMTQHQPDFDTGIDLIQSLARAIKPAISG